MSVRRADPESITAPAAPPAFCVPAAVADWFKFFFPFVVTLATALVVLWANQQTLASKVDDLRAGQSEIQKDVKQLLRELPKGK